MAQDGDTITYTFSDGTSVSEDISSIGEISVDYLNGAGNNNTANGGSVENATFDVSGFDSLYIWVGEYAEINTNISAGGRYGGIDYSVTPIGDYQTGSGSTEISFFNTDESDSDDEPFLAGAGGAGGGGNGVEGLPGARALPPPAGGDVASPGDGAIDDQNRGYVLDGGTTTLGGGNTGDGEVQITYKTGLSAPDPPSNLNAEVQ